MESVPKMLWLILGLPLLGFLVQALCGGTVVRSLGDKKGRTVMGWIAFLMVLVPFFFAVAVTFALMGAPEDGRTVISTLFNWIDLQSLVVPFELRADPLSMTMTLVITGIGSLIHLYATKYMSEDRDFTRFFTYLNLFIAFMLLLVLGNNLLMLFIGWEGVGVCSYLLIGFWYKDLANAKAANKAFITNRVGDWGLSLGIFLIAVLAATTIAGQEGVGSRWLSYDVVLPRIGEIFAAHWPLATVAALLLFVGAMGKSAQFPLYVWLPDAMAGPTPVSALIHAATMVTAGVFLLNRMAPLFEASPLAQLVVVIVGALTALIGALIAFGQTDIKKVLAYSTVSQLGYMFIACGVGMYWAGIFHVVTHAFFKALLFLGSGAVIYAMAHNQDMRNYGNLRKYIPWVFWTMFIGWAAIAGIPFLFAGFYSKEAILGAAVNQPLSDYMIGPLTAGQFAGWIGFFVAMLTAAYMTRMMMLTFAAGEERWRAIPETPYAHHQEHAPLAHDHEHEDPHGFFAEEAPHEEHEEHHDLDSHHEPVKVPWEMLLPLVVLAALSLGVSGWMMENHHAFLHWLYPGAPLPPHDLVGKGMLIGISFAVATIGIAYGYITYHQKKLGENEGWEMAKWHPFRRAANNQFGIDDALAGGSVVGGGVLGAILAWFDKWIVDGLVNLVGIVARSFAGTGKWFQTGYVRTYALVMQVGVVAVIVYALYLFMQGGD